MIRLDAGGGVSLRRARREEGPRIVALADNRRIWNNLMDTFPHPYGLRDADAFLDQLATRPGPPTHLAVAVDDDQLVGMVGFDCLGDVHRLTANVGYWIGEPYWGRGIATAALRALSSYAFSSFSLERLQAEVFAWNPASARVLEKAGYALEGRARHSVVKAGRVTDGLIYGRLRDG